jgi:hypothetical protein
MTKIHQLDNFLKFSFQKSKPYKLLVIFLCIGFLMLNITSLLLPLRESLTYDENYHFESGLAILSGKPSERGATNVAERNIMPASALNVLVSKASPVSVLDKLTGQNNWLFSGKLATILVSCLLGLYVFRWSFELYGIHAGFLALLLYLFDPNIIAHSRLITQDIFGTCSIFISIYYFWKFLKFGGFKNAFLSMITFGIAQIARYTAIYLFPIYFLLAIGFHCSSMINLIQRRQFRVILSKFRFFVVYTILLSATAVIIINIGFLGERTFTKFGDYKFESKTFTYLQSRTSLVRVFPVPVPYAYLRGLDMGKYKEETGFGNGLPYLTGRLGLEKGKAKGFKEYYLIAFIYKVPIASQLLLIMAITGIFTNKNKTIFWQNESFFIIPSLFYFCILSLMNAQLGIRYILMIFPLLFVLSSKVAVYWTQAIMRYRIFIVSLIAYLVISNFSYFPHYISYFNELLLDRRFAYTILADSNLDWGQNKFYLKDYLKKHPSAKVKPAQPQAGLVVIAANDLVGIMSKPERFQWIREKLKPVDHVAYSYLVFDIKPQDLPP